MSVDVETIVVGAGVVGLATARALAIAEQEVLVVERHDIIGSEVSSRNSEVIHAGIYYPPGSLRAKLCVAGKQMMYAFAAENGVAVSRCEKLIVATSDAQLAKLANLQETAARNGVDDLVPLDAAAARRLEPEVRCTAALLSPSTGVVDSHGFMLALQGAAEAHGAQVVLRSPVEGLEAVRPGEFAVRVGGETESRITCRRLVLAGGLSATKLAAMIAYSNGYAPPETYFAKGQYYALSGASPFKRHIYPMPDGAWLGLHATVDIGGRCKFGPDIAWIPEIDYTFEPEKITKFLDFIRSYYPGLDPDLLHADYTGIRPKIYREGEPVPDFAFHTAAQHGHDGLVMMFGIESPGLTASMAVGAHVAALLAD